MDELPQEEVLKARIEELEYERSTSWATVSIPGRPDFIGVRTRPNGQREFLTHNEALCEPYYITLERKS